MKTKLNLLIALMPLIICTGSSAQEKNSTDLKDFKIVIEKTDNGIAMKSIQGSAWIDLSFSLNDYQAQAVDEYGMTKLDNVSPGKDSNLADFLFTISKTKNGIELKGLEGTSWTNLSFALAVNGKQAIDQFGMAKLD